MTYRRLFRLLLVVGTVLLLAAWSLSIHSKVILSYDSQECCLTYGTFVVVIRERPGVPPPRGRWGPVGLDYWSVRPTLPVYRWAGKWSYQRSYREFTMPAASKGPVTAVPVVLYLRNHSFQVPLWALWLVYAGAAFTFCRLMEKRTGAGKEKTLARGAGADRPAGSPA